MNEKELKDLARLVTKFKELESELWDFWHTNYLEMKHSQFIEKGEEQ